MWSLLFSNKGFIKRIPVNSYKSQKAGKGITAASTGAADNDDFIEHMFIGSTHQYIMFFTDKGKCYWLKVYDIPEGSRTSRKINSESNRKRQGWRISLLS